MVVPDAASYPGFGGGLAALALIVASRTATDTIHELAPGIALLVVAHKHTTHALPQPPRRFVAAAAQNATDLQTTLSADVIGKPVSDGVRGKGGRWK